MTYRHPHCEHDSAAPWKSKDGGPDIIICTRCGANFTDSFACYRATYEARHKNDDAWQTIPRLERARILLEQAKMDSTLSSYTVLGIVEELYHEIVAIRDEVVNGQVL